MPIFKSSDDGEEQNKAMREQRAEYNLDNVVSIFEGVTAKEFLMPALLSNSTSMILGKPGSGKTHILLEFARTAKVRMYEIDKEELDRHNIIYYKVVDNEKPDYLIVDDLHYLLKAMKQAELEGKPLSEASVIEKLERMAEEAKMLNAKLIFVSAESVTDCVMRFSTDENRKRFATLVDGCVESHDDSAIFLNLLQKSYSSGEKRNVINFDNRGNINYYLNIASSFFFGGELLVKDTEVLNLVLSAVSQDQKALLYKEAVQSGSAIQKNPKAPLDIFFSDQDGLDLGGVIEKVIDGTERQILKDAGELREETSNIIRREKTLRGDKGSLRDVVIGALTAQRKWRSLSPERLEKEIEDYKENLEKRLKISERNAEVLRRRMAENTENLATLKKELMEFSSKYPAKEGDEAKVFEDMVKEIMLAGKPNSVLKEIILKTFVKNANKALAETIVAKMDGIESRIADAFGIKFMPVFQYTLHEIAFALNEDGSLGPILKVKHNTTDKKIRPKDDVANEKVYSTEETARITEARRRTISGLIAPIRILQHISRELGGIDPEKLALPLPTIVADTDNKKSAVIRCDQRTGLILERVNWSDIPTEFYVTVADYATRKHLKVKVECRQYQSQKELHAYISWNLREEIGKLRATREDDAMWVDGVSRDIIGKLVEARNMEYTGREQGVIVTKFSEEESLNEPLEAELILQMLSGKQKGKFYTRPELGAQMGVNISYVRWGIAVLVDKGLVKVDRDGTLRPIDLVITNYIQLVKDALIRYYMETNGVAPENSLLYFNPKENKDGDEATAKKWLADVLREEQEMEK